MKQLPIMAGVAGELAAAPIDGEVTARTISKADGSPPSGDVVAFAFGDAEPVLDRRSLLDCAETWRNGRWWTPPVSMEGLTRAFDIPGPHASCIRIKVNLLVRYFQPSRWLSTPEFRKFVIDFLALGNGYLERRDNLAGRPLQLLHSLARYTRRGVAAGAYFFVPSWSIEHEFPVGHVFQLAQEHPSQELYGVPEFLGALQAGLLGEAATLFRRRFYLNGSHAGYVFYASGTALSEADAGAIKAAMKQSKGPGNFRNLFVHAPNGKEKDIQIIPVGEVSAKDEFFNVKMISRDEMLAAHRVPPQLLGVVPANAGGFGDVEKAKAAFIELEILPLAMRMLEVNDWLGVKAVSFPILEQMISAPPAPSAG